MAGDTLIVLTDDKNLQNTDNVVPAIHKKSSSPQLIAALDKVSAAHDTTKLIEITVREDELRRSVAVLGVRVVRMLDYAEGDLDREDFDLLVGRIVEPILAAELPSAQNGGLSPDARSVTYKLKQGIKWADGQPFTADDVVFTRDFF